MEQPITTGIDLAKSVFQAHGAGADGAVVLRRRLRRAQMLAIFGQLSPCLIGMEVCAGAHYWTRALAAQRIGRAEMEVTAFAAALEAEAQDVPAELPRGVAAS